MDKDNQLFFFTIFVSLLLIFLIKARKKRKTEILPPGPPKLPIIGNIHQLVRSLPHRSLTDLANKYGPIMHLQLGELSYIVISSPELAKEVVKTHDILFASKPFNLVASVVLYGSRDIGFSPYGEHWRQLRKICTTELLSTKRVQSFRSIREEEVSQLIRSIASGAGAPVNLSKMLKSLLLCITARATIGKGLNQRDAFTSALLKIMSLLGGFNIADLFPSIKFLPFVTGMRSTLRKLQQEVDEILEVIINDHRKKIQSNSNRADDLVDVLLKLQDRDEFEIPLTKEDIKAVILDMFLAGIDTSSAVIEWTMSELIKNPKILHRVQAEVRQVFAECQTIEETRLQDLKYFNLVIKESLRFHPPSPLLPPREAGEQVELCGYKIPKKTGVFINVQAFSRDPNYWIESERFNPERFLNSSIDFKGTNTEYLPFGAGRRMCPGLLFGLAVVEFVLANLLFHFDWKIPDGMRIEDLDMSEEFGLVVRRRNDLLLTPTPYNRVK